MAMRETKIENAAELQLLRKGIEINGGDRCGGGHSGGANLLQSKRHDWKPNIIILYALMKTFSVKVGCEDNPL